MDHSTSRCDTIIALIDECLAEYDAVMSGTKRADPRRFSPGGESVITPSYLANA
jgi:hypothetical protein